MSLHLPSLQRFLLHTYIDNLVFRHEIGMNWKGKLSLNSPVLHAHCIMLISFVVTAVAGAAFGPIGVMYASGLFILVSAVAGYFVAFAAGYQSIWRERSAGTLEQICLSLMPDQELFDGKYFGTVAPFIEARRYLIVHVAVCAVATGRLDGDAVNAVVHLICGATLLVHFAYSSSIGIMAGIRAAQLRNKSFGTAIFAEREYVFLMVEITTLIKASVSFAFLFIPICIFLAAVRMIWGAAISEKDLWIVLVPFFVFPIKLFQALRDLEGQYQDRLAKRFKARILFE